MKLNYLLGVACLLTTVGVPAPTRGQAQPRNQSAPESAEAPPFRTFEEVAASLFEGRKTQTLTPAVTPLVVLPFDQDDAEAISSGRGIVADAPALAEQPLRALDAIVVVLENRRLVLPLTIVGKIETGADGEASIPDDPARRAWCNWRDNEGADFNCYVDKDGDGRLETRRRAHSRAELTPIAIDYVHGEEPMEPLRYAAASTDDYPTYDLQYRRCESDNEKIVYRVQVEIPQRGDFAGTCTSLAEPLNGIDQGEAGDYRIDRAVVRKMGPEADAEFRLTRMIPAGTILDRIDSDEAIVDLGARAPWWQEKLTERAAFDKPPYILTNGPTLVAAEGGEGDIMFTGTLGYSYTGRITNDAVSSRLFSMGSRDLRRGRFVYGLPMRVSDRRQRSPSEPMMYWCAPIEESEGEWRATCLRGGDVARAVNHNVTPAFMTQVIYGGWLRTEAVSVSAEPLTFGVPIEVRYEFRDWDDDALAIRVHSGPRGGGGGSFQVNIPRPEGQPALVRLGGGLWEIAPDPTDEDRYRIVMKEAPEPGQSALPTGDLQLPAELRTLLRQ